MTFHIPVPPRLVAPGGPASRALAVIAAADPNLAGIRALRRQLAMRIEADLALLDRLGGDPDLEDGGDDEPSLGALGGTAPGLFMSQGSWPRGALDDRENAQCIDCDGEPTVIVPFGLGRAA